MATQKFRAMGTDVNVTVLPTASHSEAEAASAIQSARARIESLEKRLSRFLPDSDVSRLNQRSGQWVEVHVDTMTVLELAKYGFEWTHGLFNPCLGRVMDRIGYSVSFECIDARNETDPPELIVDRLYLPPLHFPIELNHPQSQARVESGCKVDLGGIAKGWIVQEAVDVIRREGYSNIYCNAGGDLVCLGRNESSPWCIGVENPFAPGESVLNLDIEDLAVATSGTYRRQWKQGGIQQHHLIDPFFGRPATTDVVSCTAVHADVVAAELIAKVALLLGSQRAQPWLEKQAKAWVLITESGEVTHSWNSLKNNNGSRISSSASLRAW